MKHAEKSREHTEKYGIARRLTVYFTTCLLLFALILGLAFSALLYRYSRQSYVDGLKRTASSISEMVAAIAQRRGSIVRDMGYSYDTDKEGQFRYQSADGWTNRPVYLEDRDLRLGFFREIKKR